MTSPNILLSKNPYSHKYNPSFELDFKELLQEVVGSKNSIKNDNGSFIRKEKTLKKYLT